MVDSNSIQSADYSGYAQAAASIANAVVTGQMNRRAQKENQKQREWNEQMMDKQNAYNTSMWNATNEFNKSMWEANNEYNNAANTRQRMLDAGINPLSADWSNSTASPVSASAPTSSAVNASQMPSYDNPMTSALNAAAILAQTRKTQSETKTENQLRAERLEQLKQQNEQIRKSIIGTDLSNQSQEIINKYLDAKEAAAAEQGKESVKLTRSQREYADNQIKELQYRIDNMLPEEFKSLVKNNALLDEKVLSEQKNRDHIDKMMEMIAAEIQKLAVDTGIAEQDLYYYYSNHMSNGFMGTGLSLNNVAQGAIHVKEGIKGFFSGVRKVNEKHRNSGQ